MSFLKFAEAQFEVVDFSKENTPKIQESEASKLALAQFKQTVVKSKKALALSRDFAYLRVRAIGSLEKWGPNQNGDGFPIKELQSSYKSFVGKGNFIDHKSDDITKIKGLVVDAFMNNDDHCIECLIAVDKVSHPQLCRDIDTGVVNSVSMGTRVGWSACSVCGNIAKTEKDYCSHISGYKGMKVGMFTNNAAHKFGAWPVHEVNHDLEFIELSWVSVPAFREANVLEKIASLKNAISEIPESLKDINSAAQCKGTECEFDTRKKTAQRYKSDEDIAKEFNNFTVQKIEFTQHGGWIDLEFPEAGEHVGGGASEISDHFIIHDDGKIAFDNWYPKTTYDALVKKIHEQKMLQGNNITSQYKDMRKKADQAGRDKVGFFKNKEDWIKDELTNDETSTDEELIQHFMKEGPMSEEEARNWVSKRQYYLTHTEFNLDELANNIIEEHGESPEKAMELAKGMQEVFNDPQKYRELKRRMRQSHETKNNVREANMEKEAIGMLRIKIDVSELTFRKSWKDFKASGKVMINEKDYDWNASSVDKKTWHVNIEEAATDQISAHGVIQIETAVSELLNKNVDTSELIVSNDKSKVKTAYLNSQNIDPLMKEYLNDRYRDEKKREKPIYDNKDLEIPETDGKSSRDLETEKYEESAKEGASGDLGKDLKKENETMAKEELEYKRKLSRAYSKFLNIKRG